MPEGTATTTLGAMSFRDRKSTRLNSSHTVIYTLSLHDALPIYFPCTGVSRGVFDGPFFDLGDARRHGDYHPGSNEFPRSEEHTSELQSHSDLHSFPTRRSSDLLPVHRRESRSL